MIRLSTCINRLPKLITSRPVFVGYYYRNVNTEPKQQMNIFHDYTVIYKFPYAKIGSTINRLKLLQTVVTGIAVPACVALEASSVLSHNYTILAVAIGLFSNMTFYIFGQFFSKMIGFIYINKKTPDNIIISYISFFGKRKDQTFKIQDLVPLSDNHGYLDSVYSKVKFNNGSDTFKLHTKYANCTSIFFDIFGQHLR